MARLAATAWGAIGALALLPLVLDVPERIGMIQARYGVDDATTSLGADLVAGGLGALALVAARREWRGARASLWLVTPAAIVVASALVVSSMLGRPWEYARAVAVMGFFGYSWLFLAMGAPMALFLVALVRWLDARVSGGSSAAR